MWRISFYTHIDAQFAKPHVTLALKEPAAHRTGFDGHFGRNLGPGFRQKQADSVAQHTNKRARIQAVTANRLIDGEVVYFTADGGWSLRLADATVADGKEASQALLARAEPDVENRIVVEPYLFEVTTDSARVQPVSVREQIRMAGPTVRTDLGKQADGLV